MPQDFFGIIEAKSQKGLQQHIISYLKSDKQTKKIKGGLINNTPQNQKMSILQQLIPSLTDEISKL